MVSASEVDLSRVHVLVLDDNQNFVSIMKSILRGFGVRHIYDERDASQAMELIEHHSIDIAFVDLKMPIFSGLEFAKLVRNAENTSNRQLPIVLVTGNASRSTIADAINAGIEEVLAKPVSPKSVYDRLVRLLQEAYEYVEVDGYFGPCRRRKADHMYAGPKRRLDE